MLTIVPAKIGGRDDLSDKLDFDVDETMLSNISKQNMMLLIKNLLKTITNGKDRYQVTIKLPFPNFPLIAYILNYAKDVQMSRITLLGRYLEHPISASALFLTISFY